MGRRSPAVKFPPAALPITMPSVDLARPNQQREANHSDRPLHKLNTHIRRQLQRFVMFTFRVVPCG